MKLRVIPARNRIQQVLRQWILSWGNEGSLNLTVSSDPELWPNRISDSDRIFLVWKGPLSPLFYYDFPFDNQNPNRRFSEKHYHKMLKNGEQLARD